VTCREVSRFLQEYFHDELVAADREAVDDHVAGCSNCQTYVTQYRDTIRAAKLAAEDADVAGLPDDFVATVLHAIAQEPR